MDLDDAERDVFQHVRTRNYFDFAADVTGPLENAQFAFDNVNTKSNDSLPNFPSVIYAYRAVPYGPLTGLAFSEYEMSRSEMESLIKAQMAEVSPLLFTADVIEVNKHVFQPHFDPHAIKKGVYNALAALQGHRGTYWLSALNGYAGSTVLWQKAYTLVQNHFPKK